MVYDDTLNISEVSAGSSKEVEQHLEMGNKMLAAGQLADALSHYHAAVGESFFHRKFKVPKLLVTTTD